MSLLRRKNIRTLLTLTLVTSALLATVGHQVYLQKHDTYSSLAFTDSNLPLSASEHTVNTKLNGIPVILSSPTYICNNKLFVPMQAILQLVNQSPLDTNRDCFIELSQNEDVISVISIDCASQQDLSRSLLYNSCSYLPLRHMGDNTNIGIYYNADTQTLEVTTQDKEQEETTIPTKKAQEVVPSEPTQETQVVEEVKPTQETKKESTPAVDPELEKEAAEFRAYIAEKIAEANDPNSTERWTCFNPSLIPARESFLVGEKAIGTFRDGSYNDLDKAYDRQKHYTPQEAFDLNLNYKEIDRKYFTSFESKNDLYAVFPHINGEKEDDYMQNKQYVIVSVDIDGPTLNYEGESHLVSNVEITIPYEDAMIRYKDGYYSEGSVFPLGYGLEDVDYFTYMRPYTFNNRTLDRVMIVKVNSVNMDAFN